jgi:[acyl-carrier-protein] S-malonyltransferase
MSVIAPGGSQPGDEARVGLIFPGQGTQRAGMGRAWTQTDGWAVVGLIGEHAGVDVADLLIRADDEALRRTDLAQLAMFAIEMVILQATDAAGYAPLAYAGHSLGEITALVAAGALEVPAAARLVAARGTAMYEACRVTDGSMAALLGADVADVRQLVDSMRGDGDQVWIANINAPGQVVVAGAVPAMAGVCARARDIGAKAVSIPVDGAFHTPLMAPAAPAFAAALDATPLSDARSPVVCNVDGRAHRDAAELRARLGRQLTSPVQWVASVTALRELGCTELVEIGPRPTLTNLVRRIAPGLSARIAEPTALPAAGRR